MDFTNVKDPAGINALLESLRSSQVFSLSGASTSATPSTTATETVVLPTEEISITTPPAEVPPPTTVTAEQQATGSLGSTEASSSSLSTHLSSLLSRLQPLIHRPPATPSTESLPPPPPAPAPHQNPSSRNPSNTPTSLRELSFKKSLSILAQLLEDPLVISMIIQMRQDQENMEKSLWDGRQRLLEQQKERVKDVQEKARIINIPPTPREIEQLENEFERELRKHDRERVLVAWDSLVEKQQSTLENLGFPSMYVTKDPEERGRQQKIIDVIANAC